MARTGLTKAQVRSCRDELLAQGRHPSVDAVRLALGSGSKSTIHRYLKELAGEPPDAGARLQDTARSLNTLVEALAERLHADAERGMEDLRALCAGHEAALQEKERELAALRARVAALEARLQGNGGEALHHGDAPGPAPYPHAGTRGPSPFSIVLSGGRSDVFDIERLGLKLQ